ncbi:hypothetical protein AA0472_2933 [Acetobacter estunensis NRIC 0472]|uniref:Uncharacterized protein n=2 Tax=Acetobacteraceae TaxID=433 RepID=A0A967B6R5_9PROT|nr:hypothetical protein [Gluconobacter sp. R71656]MBF0869141.1 hypothetical protein [Gluconobacter sp. R75628]MBF0875133.1 hypothetical protein [Gluconobacter sp. R75629]MBF0883915.1 hypothetical protein [Gluconobacter potus]NHO54882.1 hypothetical protein [Acetobacter estunensis]GBQ29236.1 hypothetical protein AA0472_2933 [Acetobacter estunensis NRIC 0472]
MGFLRDILIIRERKRLRREKAAVAKRLAVSPMFKNTFAADRVLADRMQSNGVPRWKRALMIFLLR